MKPQDNLTKILRLCKKSFLYIILFSIFINLLMLTVPLYTLQLYDRVIVGQGYETLFYLCLLAFFALIIYALLELLRGRILIQLSHWLDNKLSPYALLRSLDAILEGKKYGHEVLRDIAGIKNFLKSPSVFAFVDMPWFPIFLFVIFIISFALGVIALVGAITLFFLAYLNKRLSTHFLEEASRVNADNAKLADSALHGAETIQAMGMANQFIKKWLAGNQKILTFQEHSSYQIGTISALSKFARIVIQLLILTFGAYYVMQGKLTGGGMIAASIIAGRALAPVEQTISAWKEFFSAWDAFKRLKVFMNYPDSRVSAIELPKARGVVECDNLIYMPIGCAAPLLQNIHFKLQPGQSLALLGPSGAGKSTLARLMLGLWLPTRGCVRLDGADVYTWDRQDFGRQVGYLPQNTGLIEGSIKENIACMEQDYLDEDVIAAAKMANAHEMILRLAKGYDTPVGDYQLSGGQAKRVALARAFYKNPCFIVLDEPETNLDQEGEAALLAAMDTLKSKHQSTVVIVTRNLNLIKMTDLILVLQNGKMQALGATGEILEKMRAAPR